MFGRKSGINNNDIIVTPNGSGMVRGIMYECGTILYLVHHEHGIINPVAGKPWHSSKKLIVYRHEEII